MKRVRSVVVVPLVFCLLAASTTAWADDAPPDPPSAAVPASASPEPASSAVPASASPEPASSAVPTAPAPSAGSASPSPSTGPAAPAPEQRLRFAVDPVGDTAVIAVSTGFAGLLDWIMTTGEIRPQQISPTFDAKRLLSIDRGAVSQHVDGNAATFSNVGLGAALAFAILDPVLTGVQEGSAKSALVDGILYAETLTVTMAVTNLAKVAVRRPRPLAYTAAQEHRDDPAYSNTDTDSSLSFFSGHTSTTAALTATATYLAFARSPRSARPWLTLLAGTALTSFVGFERVRAGKHFPTDVIAGAMAGGGIGLLVPHLHRTDASGQHRLWFGAAPVNGEGAVGGVVSVSGIF